MKHEWYECRVKYEKTLDTGEKKKVTEAYVVKAVSLSDAEKRIIEELKPNIVGEFAATSAKVASFKEIFQSEEDKFYLCNSVDPCVSSSICMALTAFFQTKEGLIK